MWRRAPVHPSEHHQPRRGLRRWVAFTGAVIAATAGLTALAASASAHDAPPSGTASCANAGTDWQVTDGTTFVENASGSFWKVSFSTTAGTLAAPTVTGQDDTKTGPTFAVTNIPSTVASITVTSTLVWGTSAGNYTSGSDQHSATITRPAGGCLQSVPVPGQPTVNPATCSAVGSLEIPADSNTVTWTSTPVYHAGDTGAFTVTATTTAGNVFSDGKTTEIFPVSVPDKLAGAVCDTEATPVEPTIEQSTCTGPGTNSVPTVTIPTTKGVIYKIAGAVVTGTIPETPGTSITVTAIPDTGYKFAGVDQSIDTVLTFTNPGDCAATTTPVAPTLIQSVCTGPGTNTSPSLTIPVTKGVVYKIAGAVVTGTIPEKSGSTVTVTAVPDTGYKFAGVEQSIDTVLTFTNPGNCAVSATPVTPNISEIACNGPGSDAHSTLSIPATTGVIYQVDGVTVAAGDIDETGVASVVVTAVPAAGYFFPTNTVSTWTEHFTTPDCSVGVTIVKPAFADDECSAGKPAGSAVYVIPTTEHVTYYVNGSKTTSGSHAATNGSTIKVTAVPDNGYTVSTVSSWSHTFAATPQCRGTDAVSVHRTPTTPGALASTGVPTSTLLVGGGLVVLLGLGFLYAGGVTGRRKRV